MYIQRYKYDMKYSKGILIFTHNETSFILQICRLIRKVLFYSKCSV